MSDLGLDLRTVGRAAVPVQADIVRELTEADIALLETAPRGVQAPTLKRISETHHALARLIAAGTDESEAAIYTGYSISRVSILKADPLFQELVAQYRKIGDAALADFQERMLQTGLTAQAILQERLEDDPDSISNSMLMEILKGTADRTGNGPKSTQVNVNVNLAGRIEAARKRAQLGAIPPAPREEVQGRAPNSTLLDLQPNKEPIT